MEFNRINMPDVTQSPLNPGPDLFEAAKAGFAAKGATLGAWCRVNKINRSNAVMALRGGWTGPKAKALVRRIKKAAGLATPGESIASILEPVKELKTDLKKINRQLRGTLRSQAGGQRRAKMS